MFWVLVMPLLARTWFEDWLGVTYEAERVVEGGGDWECGKRGEMRDEDRKDCAAREAC